jgi:hypothetical protein
MKKRTWILVAWLALGASVGLNASFARAEEGQGAAEDWKGAPPTLKGDFGALVGLGWAGNDGRFAILGSAAWKVLEDGFIQDINDQVYIETELGVGFGSTSTRFIYSVHGRWDFVKNAEWTPFAIGGLSGGVDGSFNLSPRFGIGAFWNVSPQWTLRGEVSHDLVVAGVSFAL